ncbi:MAG: dienelactone hydrolase family protein [Bacteroidales bacterium]|nr:dienelactone hydrolase family protein [Bacteroidales bacterium]
MRLLFLSVLIFCVQFAFTQEKVSFLSADSLRITADLYLKDRQLPFIILLHQAESSRGEYIDIAPKLMSLGYNCLAVDLRSGSKTNYISNETALRAKQLGKPARLIDARYDVEAAIKYSRRYHHKPVVLFGSSFSASLALIVAAQSNEISAVVAFSPGEYFFPGLEVKTKLEGFNKPVFAASTEPEYNFLNILLSEIPEKQKTLYKPSKGNGAHGAKILWEDNENSSDCWLHLTWFFGKLKEL